jgi:translation initiation factor 5A
MAEDGETKDDVKVPDGEIGDKIEKLFTVEEKDTSQLIPLKCTRTKHTNCLIF